VGLTAAKAVTFAASIAVAAAPVQLGFQVSVGGWGADFLTIFISMIAGLALYFSVGCAVLRATVPDYLTRLRLGQRGHAGETIIIAATCNVGVHLAALAIYGTSPLWVALIATSALFFTYPVYFLVNTLWGLQPEVRAVFTGRLRLSTPYFANVRRKVRSKAEYLPITINLAVYTESNEVIFQTIRGCQRAVAEYRRTTGQRANLVVSDDGLAKFLGGRVTPTGLEHAIGPAAERIAFYRRHQVAFVARPVQGRRGKFKKAGNLNYTSAVAWRLAHGGRADVLFGQGGLFAGGHAEGQIVIHDLICLLDKDSGLAPGVLAATSPEFAADPTLGFTQHVTRASNPEENYFAWLQARFTDMVYRVALPTKALQGLQVHLMGHSAFLRRSFLEATGDWAEDRVSEDYAKALDAYAHGWHGKYIAFEGLAFTEQVCAAFAEEADKQQRYCYGMSEVTLGRRRLPGAMRADLWVHYCSYLNLAAALPMIVTLLAAHQIYYLFAGMLVNSIIFFGPPILQAFLLGRAVGFEGTGPTRLAQVARYFALNGLAFVGYSYSMLTGFVAYVADSARGTYEPFKATSVDRIDHSLAAGLALTWAYARKHVPAVLAYAFVAVGCVGVLLDQPPHIVRPLVVFFVVAHVAAPLVLTPQLFAGRDRAGSNGRSSSASATTPTMPSFPVPAPRLVRAGSSRRRGWPDRATGHGGPGTSPRPATEEPSPVWGAQSIIRPDPSPSGRRPE
jgi:hypothetical protein